MEKHNAIVHIVSIARDTKLINETPTRVGSYCQPLLVMAPNALAMQPHVRLTS